MAARRLQAMGHVTGLFGVIDTRSPLPSTLPVHHMIRKRSYGDEFLSWWTISGGFSRNRGRNEKIGRKSFAERFLALVVAAGTPDAITIAVTVFRYGAQA